MRPILAFTLGCLAGPLAGQAPDRPSAIAGVVRDSISGAPVAGVVVRAGRLAADTTGPDGRYRVELATLGVHQLRFTHPRFAPVLEAVSFTVEVPGPGLEKTVDITWPDLERLVATACSRAKGPLALLGRINGWPPAAGSGPMEAVAGSATPVDPRRAKKARTSVSFVGTSVAVRPNGSFLICGLPASAELRVYLRAGLALGRARTVRLPGAGFAEVTVDLP